MTAIIDTVSSVTRSKRDLEPVIPVWGFMRVGLMSVRMFMLTLYVIVSVTSSIIIFYVYSLIRKEHT